MRPFQEHLYNNEISIAHLEKALKGNLDDRKRIRAERFLQSKYIVLGAHALNENTMEKAKAYFGNALFYNYFSENDTFYGLAAKILHCNNITNLAEKFYTLSGIEIPMELNTKENIIPPTSPKEITQDYFELLLDFTQDLSKTIKKLTEDSSLIEQIQGSMKNPSDDIKSFIQHSVLYDLTQILKILSDGEVKREYEGS
ncbi:MAG: hypothetical protein ACHQRM_02490 [Bacteroidia bacterium]